MTRKQEIKKMLKVIELGLNQYPDQRLGQFLCNYVFGSHNDAFYWQDERLLVLYKKIEKELK